MLNSLLDALRVHLPPPVAGVPLSSLSAVSVVDRAIGIGNRRGNETRGGFTVVALKGGRLDTVVRFQLWGTQPSQVDSAIALLRDNIEAAKNGLRSQGLLRLTAQATSVPEFNSTLNAWIGTTDYQVLYEFHLDDTEGAESLIARIPIEIDSGFGESTVVTDHLVRWDDQAAPTLEVRGQGGANLRVDGLSILAFLPAGWNGSSVTISSIVQGIESTQTFSSVRAFLEEFVLENKTAVLGGNIYQSGYWILPKSGFPSSITLTGNRDVFQVSYSDDKFDSNAIFYLRLIS
ncbi:hypothetical protein [Myxacorys almedinensis]|uniref:Uncharacterized protein n=1 Tax=Myxacorys almedinensis A TaxID=2690445 RepID=A0A8J8CMV9_9CYAN|nr:hypothetical protein [Myxacorys almedinensis]NDJ18995.1 hypothetical protein [Myxacorys almedinensis A]